jgi:hypothetical protein
MVNTSFGRKGRFGAQGPAPVPTDPGGESSRPFRHGGDSVSHERVFLSNDQRPEAYDGPCRGRMGTDAGTLRRELNV